MLRIVAMALVACATASLLGCMSSNMATGAGSDGDSDGDSDADSDADSDTDADADSDCDEPTAPFNPTPDDGDTAVHYEYTNALAWSTCAGATGYDVYFGDDCPPPDYPDNAYVHEDIAIHSLEDVTLAQNTWYCWKVVAKTGSADCYTEGPEWTFKTNCEDNTPPTVTSGLDQSFLSDLDEYVYTLTFSKDVEELTLDDLTWTPVTGSGTLDSVTQVDAQTYAVAFSGVAYLDVYTLTVETSVVDLACANPLAEAVDVTIRIANECVLDSGATADHSVPMDLWWYYSYAQSIYTPADLCGAGTISEISWDYNAYDTTTAVETIVIYMGHTTKTSYASTTSTEWVPAADMTEVYSGTITLTSPAGWVDVMLDTTFDYNGTDNLVIAVDRNTGDYTLSSMAGFYAFTAAENRSIYQYSDSTNMSPASPGTASGTNAYVPNVIINY
jgi:hypothetical protein